MGSGFRAEGLVFNGFRVWGLEVLFLDDNIGQAARRQWITREEPLHRSGWKGCEPVDADAVTTSTQGRTNEALARVSSVKADGSQHGSQQFVCKNQQSFIMI